MVRLRHVILVGMPGSGKSAVGRRLAGLLGARFSDLDSVIEDETGHTIPEIFASSGEAAFRDLECRALEGLLARDVMQVVASGGGLVTTDCGRRLIRSPAVVCVWLTASLDVLRARLGADAVDRPLLEDESSLARLAVERRHDYMQVGDTVLDTDGLDPGTAASILAGRLEPVVTSGAGAM